MSRSVGVLVRRAKVAVMALLSVVACSAGPEPGPVRRSVVDTIFVDIGVDAGLDFVHWNGMTGQLYFIEPVGAGGGLVDLDDDGDLDVVLVQGRLLSPPGESEAEPIFPPPARLGSRIFRNDLEVDRAGQGHPHFVDITEDSGFAADGYGMGVAAGDFDNDGRVDLYLTAFGHNQLWRNVSADGRILFDDVTTVAGVDDDRWSTCATFVDLDDDGWLDLFVANYVDFRLETHRPCRSPGGRQDYCGPQSYTGETDRLFRNRGDGTFEDITGPAGLLAEPSSGLGVVAADFDLDGRPDLYVTNDLRRNVLWRNLGHDGGVPRFTNVALESGVAVSMDGRSQASMGVAAGDIDNDGDDDLFMTHISADNNTLYVNSGRGMFGDRSAASGLGGPSLSSTGFGTALIDIDNDGLLDVAVANGAVKVEEAQARAGDPYPLKQPNHLFRNLGDGRFVDISDLAGPDFVRLEVSRALAVGDIDNDGRSDLLLTNNNGPARMLVNRSRDENAWIGLRLLTADGRRDALGAVVTLTRVDGTTLRRRVATDGSYLAVNDPRVLFGLGSATGDVSVRVTWPDGEVEEWHELVPGRYHLLTAGHGDVVPGQSP